MRPERFLTTLVEGEAPTPGAPAPPSSSGLLFRLPLFSARSRCASCRTGCLRTRDAPRLTSDEAGSSASRDSPLRGPQSVNWRRSTVKAPATAPAAQGRMNKDSERINRPTFTSGLSQLAVLRDPPSPAPRSQRPVSQALDRNLGPLRLKSVATSSSTDSTLSVGLRNCIVATRAHEPSPHRSPHGLRQPRGPLLQEPGPLLSPLSRAACPTRPTDCLPEPRSCGLRACGSQGPKSLDEDPTDTTARDSNSLRGSPQLRPSPPPRVARVDRDRRLGNVMSWNPWILWSLCGLYEVLGGRSTTSSPPDRLVDYEIHDGRSGGDLAQAHGRRRGPSLGEARRSSLKKVPE